MDLRYGRFPEDTHLRDYNAIHANLRWGWEDTTLYLLNHMDAFTLKHVLLWQKDANTYSKDDAYSIKWLNELLISFEMDMSDWLKGS